MIAPTRNPAYARVVNETLAHRSRTGPLAMMLIAAVVALTHPDPSQQWPTLLALSVGVLAIVRVWVNSLYGDSEAEQKRWRPLFRASVLASAASWGLVSAAAVTHGFGASALVVLLATAGSAAGMTVSFHPDLSLMRAYGALQLAPIALAAAYTGGPAGWCVAGITVFFLLYLHAIGARMHRDFVASVENVWLLEKRAQALEIERARAEQAVASADAANRAKSDFLASMSHELRTPLSAIIGYAELLLHTTEEALPLEYAEVIRRNGEHLLVLLNDLLDLSKVEAGKMEVSAAPFSLPDLLVEIASLVQVKARDKNLTLVLEAETPIPRIVTHDSTRVRQILLNLVGNAIKFTEQGSVKMGARFSAETRSLSLDVVDTGPGLSVEEQTRLFAPFAQAQPVSRVQSGTGLGLFLSRKFARMMGGDVSLESRPGTGSRFTLTLPIADADAETLVERLDHGLHVPSPLPTDPRRRLGGSRLLLAEDALDSQRLLRTMLQEAGAVVDVASDGEQAVTAALDSLTSTPYAAVLMDVEMPKLSGIEATLRLRKAGYRSPIIALTAHAMESHRLQSLEAGCDDHVVKPVRRDALIATIARHLSQRATLDSRPLLTCALPENDVLSELVPAFIESLTTFVSDLQTALAAGDERTLAALAHQLKGAGAGYGYPSISETAARLQRALGERASDATDRARALVEVCRAAIRGHRMRSATMAPTLDGEPTARRA